MRIHVTKKALMTALDTMRRIIPSRSSNPLLTGMLLSATANGLTLAGTNLEIDAEVYVAAEVTRPSRVLIPAHLFASTVASLGAELVELEVQDTTLFVRGGGSTFKLKLADAEAYAPITFAVRPGATLPSGLLAQALSSVRYAASNEAFQAVFRGIKWEWSPESLRVVASDGFRVALYQMPLEGASGILPTLIVPARSTDELLVFLKASDGDVQLSADSGVLTATSPFGRMNFKLLDGEFPDYGRVIPKDSALSFTVSGAALRESAERVSLLADRNANNRLEMTVGGGKLRICAQGDYGDADDVLEVQQEGRESAMSLALNARHLLDALGPVRGEVRLSMTNSTSPVKLLTPDQSGYLAVMVTLRV